MPEVAEEVEKAPSAPDAKVQGQQEMEYPGMMKRALIMVSVYLSVFLITLVRAQYSSNRVWSHTILTNHSSGPKYYLDGYSQNHR